MIVYLCGTSFLMQIGSFFSGSKVTRMWNKSLPSICFPGQECAWSCALTGPNVCMTQCIIKHRDNFIYDLVAKCCKIDVAWLWWFTVLLKLTLKELKMGKPAIFCICIQILFYKKVGAILFFFVLTSQINICWQKKQQNQAVYWSIKASDLNLRGTKFISCLEFRWCDWMFLILFYRCVRPVHG